MLSGNNGILQRATDAKTQTGIEQEKEIVALAYNSVLAKKVSNGNLNAVTDSELNDELDNSEATASGNPIIVTFNKSGNTYEIDSNGVIKPSTPKDPNATLKVAEHKNEKFDSNTELEDKFGNKIVVPAGFKITSDSPDSVTGGIIIEDVDAGTETTSGSQFVWIAVGDVYTDINGTKNNIELCRCGFNENGEKVSIEEGYRYELIRMGAQGVPGYGISQISSYTFSEDTISRIGSVADNINASAKNISDFLSKASIGYYIERYEARTPIQRTSSTENSLAMNDDNLTQLTEKKEDHVYTWITPLQASSLSRNMYTSDCFESDLINSYAWDTAINFLQTFDDRNDKNIKYSLQMSLNDDFASNGTTSDKICNIYDMASNCGEFTTETCSNSNFPVTGRGGVYYNNSSNSYILTCTRFAFESNYVSPQWSFRTILYVK